MCMFVNIHRVHCKKITPQLSYSLLQLLFDLLSCHYETVAFQISHTWILSEITELEM